ncbi:alanine--tRNA ligase-like [Phyllobates terribilis]|uniref:alanine--tRNA ligase-like n=1 Tax=Phyllobates terribilis TaxID=111132 RepID=UPI003CCB280E
MENGVSQTHFEKGVKVDLQVDGSRRSLNSRLHSAGHLLDVCMNNIGLGHFEPSKGYHFPDGPFVEYKGIIPQSEQQLKREQLEQEGIALIYKGGKVYAATLPYDDAAQLCDNHLPDYISKDSTPRIMKFGDNPGCPCGPTHVNDISDIKSLKIRTKKGLTKV